MPCLIFSTEYLFQCFSYKVIGNAVSVFQRVRECSFKKTCYGTPGYASAVYVFHYFTIIAQSLNGVLFVDGKGIDGFGFCSGFGIYITVCCW